MLENYGSVASLEGPATEHGQEMIGGNKGFSVEKDKDDVSEGNVEDRDQPPRQGGSHADRTADKPVLSHGGCSCESPVQEVRSTKTRTNECLRANQRICSRENTNENLASGKTFSQNSALSSHQTQSGDAQWNEGDGAVLNEVQNEDLEGMFWNRGGPNKQKRSHMTENRVKPISCQGHDFHELIQTAEGAKTCFECGMTFTNQSQYEIHLQMHIGKKTHQWLDVGKNCVRGTDLHSRQKTYEREKSYSCTGSGKSFSHKPDLSENYCGTHSRENPLLCIESRKAFSGIRKGNVHLPKHRIKRAHKCFWCRAFFSCRSKLLVHKIIHTKERRFECSVCGKTFNWSSSLQQHQRTHTGERPFECSDCGRRFSQNSSLQMYQRTHTKERPFKCSKCGNTFSWSSNLQRHQRTHRKESPFEYLVCGKRFCQNSHLQQHQRTHTRERPL
ncbi:zinc finger protein 391-like isoform X2 [Sphaerodactylus townsendi]|uniref:zinc finger protein 391-like isoform X2 n=1 Tax=Sphaerodactylus townsendi TaxID=933632 RepID=UPI002025DD83|nr:zinc finger protein 391-like isoform X2 [Sphaerodactylus townsendi]